MAAEAAFILGASDAILQSLDHLTLPSCMPRKGSLTLDHNGLTGLVQKVNKHYTCLLGTEALKGNCRAGLRCLFFLQCECIAKESKTSISKEGKKPKPIINP